MSIYILAHLGHYFLKSSILLLWKKFSTAWFLLTHKQEENHIFPKTLMTVRVNWGYLFVDNIHLNTGYAMKQVAYIPCTSSFRIIWLTNLDYVLVN